MADGDSSFHTMHAFSFHYAFKNGLLARRPESQRLWDPLVFQRLVGEMQMSVVCLKLVSRFFQKSNFKAFCPASRRIRLKIDAQALFGLEKLWKLGTPLLLSMLTITPSRFQTSIVFFLRNSHLISTFSLCFYPYFSFYLTFFVYIIFILYSIFASRDE